MRSMVNISLDTLALNSQLHQTSGTTEVVRSDYRLISPFIDPIASLLGPSYVVGDVTCFQFADMSQCQVTNSRGFTGIARTIDLNIVGSASDPCVNLAANIDYSIHVFMFANDSTGRVEVFVNGLIDEFPAFEMYSKMDGVVNTLFRAPPPAGNTVMDLLGGPNMAVTGRVRY
jgi:hypothetical protein